jgi:phosphopantothenoylcysteine synthetase/decarboxylase
MSRGKRLVLGVTGSVSAYKAVDIASRLTQQGVEVDVILTANGARFITAMALSAVTHRPVVSDMWDNDQSRISHIEVADAASLVLVAPTTANVMAKMAHGLADDSLTAVLLATLAPVLVAPAMNGKMWQHAATQANYEILQKRGVKFIGPARGMLACGYEGIGRLAPVNEIIAAVGEVLKI